MFNKKHIFWWIGMYAFWLMIFQKRSFTLSTTATVEFCYLLFIAANFYFNLYFTVPRYLYRQKYLEFALLFIAGIMITAMLRVPLAAYLNAHYFFPGESQPSLSAIFIASLLNIFIWVAGLLAGKIIIDRYRLQRHLEMVEMEKSQAELDFLNAQFNPHFLFNSLNTIYGEIDKQNIVARNMMLTFSDMLRYQLYDCNKKYVDIDQEISYLKNYISIQQARKEDNLVVNFRVESALKNISIAPLLFIAFIENAFKYVSCSDDLENRIDIEISQDNESLWFRCFNSKDAHECTQTDHSGIGISNTKRRLALHYPDRHELEISDTISFYKVALRIQLP
jgi:two-component system LytT family sensor kinase